MELGEFFMWLFFYHILFVSDKCECGSHVYENNKPNGEPPTRRVKSNE